MGPLGPSNHDFFRFREAEKGCDPTLWRYFSHATPAFPFPTLPPMFIPGRTPAKNCSHCGAHMHMTNECMSHAVFVVQRASQKLKARGLKFLTPNIHQYETRQRPHAGPGWSHIVTVGCKGCGTVLRERDRKVAQPHMRGIQWDICRI